MNKVYYTGDATSKNVNSHITRPPHVYKKMDFTKSSITANLERHFAPHNTHEQTLDKKKGIHRVTVLTRIVCYLKQEHTFQLTNCMTFQHCKPYKADTF